MKKALLVGVTITTVLMLNSCSDSKDNPPPSTAIEKAPPQPARADLMVVPDELKSPAQLTVSSAYIDLVNEKRPEVSPNGEFIFDAKTDLPLRIMGWAYDETNKAVPEKIWIELDSKENGQRIFLPTVRYPRPDVASSSGFSWARQSGITTNDVRDHMIPAGSYDLKVFQIQNGSAELTRYVGTKSVTLKIQ